MNNSDIQKNLNNIKKRIKNAAIACNRNPKDIHLVAVSKFQPAAAIQDALTHQQLVFGENRVQEAKEKFIPLIEQNPRLRLHIIGPIQSNKIVDAIKIAHTIETIDRFSLLDPLQKAIDKVGRCPELFIQINIGEESQKAGILPSQANTFIETCIEKFGERVQGVMGIPPVNEDPSVYFRHLTAYAHQYYLSEVSMGMSADFEEAIACGATFVRIGSAIFGNRPTNV